MATSEQAVKRRGEQQAHEKVLRNSLLLRFTVLI
jgi:hypothetical protein